MRTLALVGLAWLLVAPPRDTAAVRVARQDAALGALLEQAGAYVGRFVDVFSHIVAEERYVQDVSGTKVDGPRPRVHRALRSDVLLLHIGGPLEWRPFRDVFEVDRQPVRDRDDRLMALFQQPSANALEQAARFAQESARYNIGLTRRTINTPVLTLLFLQHAIQPRFRFKLGKVDRDVGLDAQIVEYREETRPTLIRGITSDVNTDLRASGRFWIDRPTGRVDKTELVLVTFGMRAELVTSFQPDERLGIAVPSEMHEEYDLQRTVELQGPTNKAVGLPQMVRRVEQTLITGVASYSNFRRFEVTTSGTPPGGR